MRAFHFSAGLPITIVIALAFGANQSNADEKFTCPVTKPSDPPFVPPGRWPSQPWIGTEKLWTMLSFWGKVERDNLGHEVPKISWWSAGYDWQKEPNPSLTITGRRLDGPSAPLIFDGVSNAYIEGRGSFMPSSVHLPTLGCWEITGHYKGTDLTFVVKVVGS
jgi:hypothetical protein